MVTSLIMSEELPFDPNAPIESCPFCGQSFEDLFIDCEGQPVLVDAKECTLTPVYITDIGTFMLLEMEDKNIPPYCQHLEWHHVHDK